MKILWFIFFLLFLIMAGYHFSASKNKIPYIQNKGGAGKVGGVKIGLSDFVSDFNQHVDELNKSNKQSNMSAVLSYLLAALTAIISFSQV